MDEQQQPPTDRSRSPLSRPPSCDFTPIHRIDSRGRVSQANHAARHLLRPYLDEEGLLEERLCHRLSPAIERERTIEELRLDGTQYRIVPYALPESEGVLLFWQELTARSRYEQLMLLVNHLLEHTLDGVILTDSHGIIEQVNPAFTRITGYSPEEVVGKRPTILKSYHQNEEFYRQLWEALRRNGTWSGELLNRTKSGEAISVWQTITRIGGERGEHIKYLSIFHDTGNQKSSNDQLLRRSNYDILTGLPNRQLFYDRLSQAIASARREGDYVGVLLLDIDNFKKINDSLGHRQGDNYLRVIGERLASACREEDTVARLSGDEFGMITRGLEDQNHALEILERINSVLHQPVEIADHQFVPSASIGVTFFPEDGDNSDTLIKNADLAMYKAKQSDRGRYALFNSELHQRAQQRISLESNLHRALEQDEFQLYYQPKIRAADGVITGAEALVRWNHRGMVISPAEFIPIAEETGIIFPLGHRILTHACAHLVRLRQSLNRELTVAVNVSGRQFRDSSLVSQLKSILRESGADPQKLMIEITEHIAIGDVTSTLHMMGELDSLGIGISIDDFGTGYSSLAYVKRFTARELKIDRSFVRDLPHDPGDRAIVKAVISMAHELGMQVTAEGVESEEHYHYLRSLGCDYLQGYYFSQPVPFESLMRLIERGWS